MQRTGLGPAVVWFDAHGDVQTMETSTSGYVGGIPLRVLVGYRPDPAVDRLGLAVVPEERVLLVDGRDLDPPEDEYLRGAPVRRSTVAGVGPDTLPDGPLLLHVDLDVIDPGDVPGFLFPTPRRARCRRRGRGRVTDTGRVVALSVGCTWSPAGDDDPDGVRGRLLGDLLDARP